MIGDFETVVEIAERLLQFADRFGLDVRALQEWEQGRRAPYRAARVLLTVIDRDPEAVVRALGADDADERTGRTPAP